MVSAVLSFYMQFEFIRGVKKKPYTPEILPKNESKNSSNCLSDKKKHIDSVRIQSHHDNNQIFKCLQMVLMNEIELNE